MLFAILMKVKAGTEAERLQRRLQQDYPESVRVVAEYWLHTSDPEVILFVESEGFANLFEVTIPWSDFFDIKVYPAIEAQEGMAQALSMMGEGEGNGGLPG